MTDIDWPGIRAAAVTIGVREAARRAATNLPPVEANRFVERVLKRSTREGWIKEKQAATALPLPRQIPVCHPLRRHGCTTGKRMLSLRQPRPTR